MDPNSDYQAFCVQVLCKKEVKIKETSIANQTQFMEQVYASRAWQKKAQAQVMPYNSRKGAVKIMESANYDSFYGQLVIFNDSNQVITEDIIFELNNMKMYNIDNTKVSVNL